MYHTPWYHEHILHLSSNFRIEYHEVVLPPDFVCDRCILQGVRQAAEFLWIDTVFVSCADISIVDSSCKPCMTCRLFDIVLNSYAGILVCPTAAVCDNMTCSGHGICRNGKCVCDRLYSGDICQNKGNMMPKFEALSHARCISSDECVDESDCSGHGACIQITSSWYPSKQCYCDNGWFGDNCAMRTLIKLV